MSPGASAGTTKAEIPLAPAFGSVEAKTVYTSAMPAFEMNDFRPSSTQSPPSLVARVLIAPTSEPASISVMAKPHISLPSSISGSQRACSASLPPSRIGIEPSAWRA